jgi:hypothetical protein
MWNGVPKWATIFSRSGSSLFLNSWDMGIQANSPFIQPVAHGPGVVKLTKNVNNFIVVFKRIPAAAGIKLLATNRFVRF